MRNGIAERFAVLWQLNYGLFTSLTWMIGRRKRAPGDQRCARRREALTQKLTA
jgi:hypothetical protein